ncbi:MAG: hypothetical protein SH817_02170 [Leptospira sp.]|nr:hypothetical protein [Leptospira sp.]
MKFLKILFILLLSLIQFSLFASDVTKPIPSAKEFLSMDLDKALPWIESLDKEETKELITSLRAEIKSSYPNIDHFYFLISHLEEISAIQKEQARLKSLLWVFGLALLLFVGFLAFLLQRQRSAIQHINQLNELE